MASAQELQAKVAGAAIGTKKRRVARSLNSDPADDYFKIGAFGEPGSGKTLAVIGFLEHGLKVFIASTDFGGHGLRTLKEEISRRNPDLFNLLRYDEFATYDEFAAFLTNPDIVDVEEPVGSGTYVSLNKWGPKMLVWDGASNWQVNLLDEKVLSFTPGKNSQEARFEGLKAELTDWDATKRGTFRALNDFLTLHNSTTGERWHKYVTFYENETGGTVKTSDGKEENKPTKRIPFIQGGAKNFIGGGFDLLFRATKIQKVTGGEEFKYICEANTKDAAKKRGLNVSAQEPADMKALWAKIRGGAQ